MLIQRQILIQKNSVETNSNNIKNISTTMNNVIQKDIIPLVTIIDTMKHVIQKDITLLVKLIVMMTEHIEDTTINQYEETQEVLLAIQNDINQRKKETITRMNHDLDLDPDKKKVIISQTDLAMVLLIEEMVKITLIVNAVMNPNRLNYLKSKK